MADEILIWPTNQIQSWLRSCPADEGLPWLAIAEGAAMAANSLTDGVSATRRETLGNLAVYSFQMAIIDDPKSHDGAILSEIVLRSGLIRKLGMAVGTVRDPGALWCILEKVLMQAEKVRNHIVNGPADLTTLSLDDMLLLRQAKSVLRCAEPIFQADDITWPSLVDWWWKHRDRLP